MTPIPSISSPDCAEGSDGNLWFCQPNARQIGRLTPSGDVTTYSADNIAYQNLCSGPDGNLWFTGSQDGIGDLPSYLGSFNPFTWEHHDYVAQTPDGWVEGDRWAGAPVLGPDGALWTIGEKNAPGTGTVSAFELVRIPLSQGVPESFDIVATLGNQYTEFSGRLIVGPDGNFWLGKFDGDTKTSSILRITPQGDITGFSLPPDLTTYAVEALILGPDGNIWFNEYQDQYKVARITMDGTVSEFPRGTPPSSGRR